MLSPVQIILSTTEGGVWLERTVMKDPQHGLQVGKVSVAHWDNEAGM